MNKKTILISNYTASIRPVAWLALAILACGAFGNSVQAQQWLSENFDSLGAGVNMTVGGNCVAAGTAGYATGATGGGALKITKAISVSGTEVRWTLSDSLYSASRASGYITFRIQQTPGVTSAASAYMNFRIGSSDANNLSSSPTTWFELRFLNLPYTTGAVDGNNANLKITGGGGSGSRGNVSLDNATSPVQIRIWYNTTGSAISYAHPGTGATLQLSAGSFVVYAGNSLVSTGATGGLLGTQVTPATGATPVSTVGKIGFTTGTSQSSDFIIDDIYAGASAPVSGVGITSGTTATAQAGYPFSYTITSSGVTAPSYSTSTLPSGLSVDSSTGVIAGTLPTGATLGLSNITLTATGTGGPATANLALTITAPPVAAPAITSAATAPGFLTKAFTYQITTQATTPVASIPTSYAIATGTLPAGLNLNTATGLISGTPTELTPDGGTQITYTATNPFGTSNAQTLTITINPAPLYTWNNTGTVWATGSSWTNGVAPANSAITDIAAFGNLGSTATSVDVGAGRSIGGIVFNSGAYAYTWTGTDITVGGTSGITNNSTAIQTFGNKILNTGANPTWTSVFGGAMVFSGGIDLGTTAVNRTVTFAGAGNVTVSGTIANGGTATAGAVTFSSTGVNLLSGNSTYGGATTIAANSTLKIGSATALGSTSGSTVVSSGGVLDLNGQTISGEPLTLNGSGISTGGALINTGTTDASWSGTVALGNAATYISASAGKKITLSGVVSGDAKGIYKIGTGTLELSGANTYTGLAEVADGTMILSAPNSAPSYKLQGYDTNIFPVLKVSATNAMSSSANVVGSSSTTKTGTLEFTTNGNYTLNQYNMGNINFANSSGLPTTLTFTNLTNFFTTAAGRTLANKSTNLTITFNGQMDIGGSTDDVCKIEAFGPVVISNSVFSSSTSIRGLEKSDGAATLTMYGVNNYNGTTTVSKGTLSIPTGGSLTSCGNTIVKGSGTTTANSASLNLAGAAGVVQVSTNGFVRGGGSITSLQVQEAGAAEVAVGTTWTTGGTIEFAAGSKVSVTGTPDTGNTYTLMTASANITGSPILVGATGWALRVDGANLLLEEIDIYNIGVGVTTTFSDIITGTAPLVKKGLGTAIITGNNDFTGGTVLQAGTLQVENVNGLGTGAVTLTSGTLKSTVDLNLGRFVAGAPAIIGTSAYQAVYGANSRVQYSGQPTTINGPVTLDVGTDTTMTMGTLIGNSSASSLVTKIGAGTVKLMGGTTKLDSVGMALNGNGSSVLGGWRIQEGTVWFAPSSNNGGGSGPITLAGGNAKFTKLQNSNGTYTGYEVPSDLTLESNGLIQFDPDPVTLLGQNNLGFKNLSIGANTLEVATATTSSVVGQELPSVNFKSATLTGSAILKNPANLNLNLQAVSGTSGFTKTGSGTLYMSDQPNQAAAFAVLTSSSGVESINVEYAGSGYLVAPAVNVVPVNGGSGATASATIDNGRVTSIRVTAPGSGYSSIPRVQIDPPPTIATANTYSGVTTVEQGKLNLNGSYASSVTVKSGAALQLDWLAPAQAKCSIDSISTGSSPNAANAYVKNLYLTKSVGGYQPGTFEFDLPAPVKADGTGTATGTATYVLAAARARATVDSNGFISALSIVNGGSGYAITPMVTIPAPTVPTVVVTTTGSITFESGAKLALNIVSPTSASYTLVTADGGITGNPTLEPAISGYTLKKSTDGRSLILDLIDTTKPVIALIGGSSVNVPYGSSYSDLGAKVTDNKDTERAINGTGSVDTSVPGSYTITFNAMDAAGNIANTVTRTVVVGAAPVADGYALYLSSNGVPAGTAFNAQVNGVTVGLAYAFGSSNGYPRNNGVTAVPVVSGNQLTYTFDVKDDSALTVTYQTSSDLVTWSAAQPISPGTGSSPSGFLNKQAQATGSGKLFIRINVTR
jgi:autotransporter-associated beta strand protein